MEISEQYIKDLARFWQEEFGETLSPDAARHEASLLLELYMLLYGTSRGGDGQTGESATNRA
jgi:hypothetical protein